MYWYKQIEKGDFKFLKLSQIKLNGFEIKYGAKVEAYYSGNKLIIKKKFGIFTYYIKWYDYSKLSVWRRKYIKKTKL